MSEKNTSNQENRLCDLFRDAVRALGLSKDEAQEIISNGGTMQTEIKPILQKLAITNKRFGAAIRKFEITIPVDYKHDTQIDVSVKKTKKENSNYLHYSGNFTSKNFERATNKLEPGKTYKVKIFPILATVVKSEDCMVFLRKQNAIFVGGQGITFVYDVAKDQLPKGKWVASFDEKNALWKDADGLYRVPCTCIRSNGGSEFALSYFADAWGDGDCLLCFCDK